MRIDQAPEGGKFRATAAAALDGEAGVWGLTDLLCVKFDATGDLILATAGACDGVIWTLEGRNTALTGSTVNEVIGGRKYTVFTFAELVDTDTATGPAAWVAGDVFYGTAAGDVLESASSTAGDIYIGTVLGDGRFILNINVRPVFV
jgi:hypothetical protein